MDIISSFAVLKIEFPEDPAPNKLKTVFVSVFCRVKKLNDNAFVLEGAETLMTEPESRAIKNPAC